MNIATADTLMAIFGFRRVSTNETEQTAEYVGPRAAEEPDTCPGEWSLEDRVSE